MLTRILSLKELEVEVVADHHSAIKGGEQGGIFYPPEPANSEIRRIYLVGIGKGGVILRIDIKPFLSHGQVDALSEAFTEQIKSEAE